MSNNKLVEIGDIMIYDKRFEFYDGARLNSKCKLLSVSGIDFVRVSMENTSAGLNFVIQNLKRVFTQIS